MVHLLDSDQCKLDATVLLDCIIEIHEIPDPSQGLQKVPFAKLCRTKLVLERYGSGEAQLQSLDSNKNTQRGLKNISTN